MKCKHFTCHSCQDPELAELVRERDEANARRADLRTALEWANEERDRLQRERDEALARCETLRELADAAAYEQGIAQRRMMDAQRERDEARAEAERLRHELSEAVKSYASWPLLRDSLTGAMKDRDEARAEVDRFKESAKAAWEVECITRDERDRYHAELKQERAEVERLRRMLPVHPSSLTDVCTDAFHRGAEAMREACARWMSEREGISQWVYDDALSALPIPEDK